MKNSWHIIIILSGTVNALWVGYDWYIHAEPNWFVWLSSIFFSTGMIFSGIKDLLGLE